MSRKHSGSRRDTPRRIGVVVVVAALVAALFAFGSASPAAAKSSKKSHDSPSGYDKPGDPTSSPNRITDCTQRRKRGFVVLADKQFPEDGFVPPYSVKSKYGEELIGYAAFGRNPKRGWGLEGSRFVVDKDNGLGVVIVTDHEKGKPYKVHCDIKGSPIGFDLDSSGAVEQIVGTFQFDLDANGELDTLTEWFAPTEGILINTNVPITEPGTLTGQHLFGDLGGQYADGYERLAMLDTNADHQVAGSELTGLAVWTDVNSNARVETGEISALADTSIVGVSTNHTNMTSIAYMANGSTMVTQDLWFAIAPDVGGMAPTRLALLGLFGLGVLGYAMMASRRRSNRLDVEIAELLTSELQTH